MSNPSENAGEVANDGEVVTTIPARPPRRAQVLIVEVLGKEPGAFTLGLGLSAQDPEQVALYGEGETIAPVDIVAMALAEIVKTSPKAFTDRLNAIQKALSNAADDIANGADPADAARENLDAIEVVDDDG